MDAQEFSLYLCPECGKQFDGKAKLQKHTRQVHDLRPESCKECEPTRVHIKKEEHTFSIFYTKSKKIGVP